MTKDQVIAMAREAGASTYTNRHFPERPIYSFTLDALERFATLVRNAKLEEAINACNVEASAAEHAANSQAEYGADCCACAIRNLKEPT